MFHFNDQRKLCLKEHFRNKPNTRKFKELMTYKNEYDLKKLCRFINVCALPVKRTKRLPDCTYIM